MSELETSLLLEFYKNIYTARRLDEGIWDYYTSGKLEGMQHLGIGEEAIGTASMKVFNNGDIVTPHHRSHAHLIARGIDLKKLLSESLLKKTGATMGKGGEPHFVDIASNCYILGGTLGMCFTVSMGMAYELKRKGTNNIVAAYTGESATNEGAFHEAMNMATAMKLPLLLIIHNNSFGISGNIRKMTGMQHMSTRAMGYGIPGVTIQDGNDVEAVYNATTEAAKYVREGNGPMILEFMTWRKMGHTVADPGEYKDKAEQAEWLKKDPLDMLFKKLVELRNVPEAELTVIREKADAELADAWQFALNAPYAEAEILYKHIYAGS